MNDLTPQERRQQRTHQMILDTALELIKEQGIDKWSLRELARRIDYSPSGLYEYFDSKDDILNTLWQDIGSKFRTYLQSVSLDLPPEDYLLELGMAYVRFARDYPNYFIVGFSMVRSEMLSFEEARQQDPEPSFMILVRGVEKAIEAGVIRVEAGFDVFEISYTVWALVHGMGMLQATYLADFTVDFKEIDRAGLRSLLRGLLAT
ncbi:MAG: TetR/AcrR family transcriptional regulator [Anaerolineales bacterium]|nr:TetR/AcrR family transcriptional regulator [Anaerolineales bacterium]